MSDKFSFAEEIMPQASQRVPLDWKLARSRFARSLQQFC